MAGQNPPSTQIGTCEEDGTQYAWAFSGAHELPLYETVSTTITLDAALLSQSDSTPLTLTLPYCGAQLEKRLHLSIDSDDPEVSIAQPHDGAVIRGETYVVGGTSDDTGSWVTDVALCLRPAGSSGGVFEAAEGSEHLGLFPRPARRW